MEGTGERPPGTIINSCQSRRRRRHRRSARGRRNRRGERPRGDVVLRARSGGARLRPGTKERPHRADRAKITPFGDHHLPRTPSSVTLTTASRRAARSDRLCWGERDQIVVARCHHRRRFLLRCPPRCRSTRKNIGGPSAGLAMTLTLIDKLSKDSISGQPTIAATGTMASNGNGGRRRWRRRKNCRGAARGREYFLSPRSRSPRRKASGPGLTNRGCDAVCEASASRPAKASVAASADTPYEAPLSHYFRCPTP
jgi:hypothetical protein